MTRAVIVTGSRHIREDALWADFIWKKIAGLRGAKRLLDPHDIFVIHGDCRGADRIAAKAATTFGMNVLAYPYPSDMGKAGGPYRNRQMLQKLLEFREYDAMVAVLAFHPSIDKSKGTKDMIAAAEAADVPVRLYERASA